MSLKISETLELRSPLSNIAKQPANDNSNNLNQTRLNNAPIINSVLDLNCSKYFQACRVQRNSVGSLEKLNLGQAKNLQVDEKTSSGIILPPAVQNTVLVVEKQDVSFFGQAEPEIYVKRSLSEKGNGLFLRPVKPLGEFSAAGGSPQVVLSGTCLFGSTGLAATLADGQSVSITDSKSKIDKPVVDLKISEDFSLYEVESMQRLAATFRVLKKLNPCLQLVSFQIPREEYMLYCLKAKLDGLLSASDYDRLCCAIQNRADKTEAYIKRLTPPDLNIKFNYIMEPACELITSSKIEPESIIIEKLSKILCDAYPKAADILTTLPKVKELAKFIYRGEALAYIQALQETPNKSAIAVENFAMSTLLNELSNRKPRKFMAQQGLKLDALYCYESLLPVVGEMSFANIVSPIAASRFGMPPIQSPVSFQEPVNKLELLYFSGLEASPQLVAEIESTYRQIG